MAKKARRSAAKQLKVLHNIDVPKVSKAGILRSIQGLIQPLTPFEKRMAMHPWNTLISADHPEHQRILATIKRLDQVDNRFRDYLREYERRLPLWEFARYTSGSGFLMSKTLRGYFLEYLDRFRRYGPDSMPTSFNVIESFMCLDKEFLAYDIRSEKEHLLHIDDYFEWYNENRVLLDPGLVIAAIPEGVVYSYDMAGDANGYRIISDTSSSFVLAGVSMVRHENELSCLLVAGENPPRPSDKEVEKTYDLERSTRFGSMQSDPDLTVQSRYLDRFPGFARIHLLSRFDLVTRKYNVRYVNLDLGRSYRVLTDDFSVFDDLDEIEKSSLRENIMRLLALYDSLFSALSSLIYLPIAFIDRFTDTYPSEFRTEFDCRVNDDIGVNVLKEFKEPIYSLKRILTCLPTGIRSIYASRNVMPPAFESEKNGYWKLLSPGVIGQDKLGKSIVGRTWVSRSDIWLAQSPGDFLLERPDGVPDGSDPGIIYVMRSASHNNEIYKVGLTRKTAEERSHDLSRTGTPTPFAILAQWNVGECLLIEKEVHRRLDLYRFNPEREFFHCELSLITKTIESVIKWIAEKRD